jgi:hypothetical protein
MLKVYQNAVFPLMGVLQYGNAHPYNCPRFYLVITKPNNKPVTAQGEEA